MSYRHIKVTPSMAEAYLKLNTHNRTLRQSHVEYLEKLILNDEWRLTGEPIRFNGKLNNQHQPLSGCVLLDGQHRLNAFLNSGKKSLMFEIIDELPAESFQYMDQGRPRTASDVLSIVGYRNTNALAGVGRALYLMDNGGIKHYWQHSQGGKRKASNHQILQFVRTHKKPIELAIKETTRHISQISMSMAAHASAYYLFRKRSLNDCEKFFYALGTGEKLTKTNPILHLRDILLDHRFSRKKARQMRINTRDLLIIDIMAWNMFRDGIKISNRKALLEFDGDSLPRTIK